MNDYPCTVEKCGRKFSKKEELKDHYLRRHTGQPLSNGLSNPPKNPFETFHSETTLNLKINKILKTEAAKTIIKKPLSLQRKKNPTPLIRPINPEKIPQKAASSKEIPEESSFKNITGNSLLEEKSHENTTSYSTSFNNAANDNFVGNLVDLNQEKKAFEDLMKDEDDENELDILDSPDKKENVELEQIMDSKKKLTEDYLVMKSGIFDKIEQISTVKLNKNKGFFGFLKGFLACFAG